MVDHLVKPLGLPRRPVQSLAGLVVLIFLAPLVLNEVTGLLLTLFPVLFDGSVRSQAQVFRREVRADVCTVAENRSVLLQAAALVELLTVLDLFCGGDYLAVVADDFIGQRHGERIGAHRQDCHNGKAQEHHKCNGLYPAFTGVGTDRVRAAGDLGDLLARYGFLSHIVCLQCAYIFVIRVGSFGEARQASTTSPPVFILALQILI